MGQKRLDKAIDLLHRRRRQHQEDDEEEQQSYSSQQQPNIVVEWKPFVIDPGTKEEGELMEDYCRRRWGGSGWTRDLRRQGQSDGANFSNWKWWPNTWKGHQLIQYARDRAQIDTSTSKAVLFEAMYEQGENLSSVDTLVKIGTTQLGIANEGELRSYLEQDQGLAKVRQEIESGRRAYRISGVPFFVIGRLGDPSKRPYGISGAQKPATLLEIFEELLDAEDDENSND